MPLAFISAGQSNAKRAEPALELALKAAYGPETALIRCAVGGSWIKGWIPGGKFYEAARLKIAPYIAHGFAIGAICFNQGEADTRPGMAGEMWGHYYQIFLDNMPSVPAVHSVLGAPPTDGAERPLWMDVFRSQRDFGGSAVHQWDVPRIPNDVHYLPETYRKYHVPRYTAHLLRLVPKG